MRRVLNYSANVFLITATVMLFTTSVSFAFSPTSTDEKVIAGMITEGYADAINAGNHDAFAQLFTKDATRISPTRPPETTREIIKTGIEKVFNTFDFDVVLKLDHINVDGDFALAYGVASGERTKTADGKTVGFRARSVWLFQQLNGGWHIWRQAWYPIKNPE